MPDKQTVARARADNRQGKAPSTQAGEFVKKEIDRIRAGVHGARSTRQAIAIGLSEARRTGVNLPPPAAGKAPHADRQQASRDLAKSHGAPGRRGSAKRSRASLEALKREGTEAASPSALARHSRAAAGARSAAERSASAKSGSATKGAAERSAAAAKPARTRSSHAAAR